MSDQLSEREKQVAAHLAAGLRVAGVASELCIAEITVRNHLRNIFGKLDVHSQGALIERLRAEPELLGGYRSIGGLHEPSLVDELGGVDRDTEQRIDEIFASMTGLAAMKAVLRAALPLDEAGRREWRTRMAVHAVAPAQRDVRQAFESVRRKWRTRPAERIAAFQERGWVRPELDPDEVKRDLFSAVYAAVMALLADPSPEEEKRQLAAVDAVLESIAVDGGEAKG